MDRESSDIVRMIRDARSARQGVLGRLRSQAVPAKGKAAAAKQIHDVADAGVVEMVTQKERAEADSCAESAHS